MNILPAFTTLLVCQLIGTVIQQLSGLPVPGAVIGMLMLFSYFMWAKKIPSDLQHTSLAVLRYLPLFFVPAGVGIIQQFPLIKREWLSITIALIGSTAITIALTGWFMQLCLRLMARRKQAQNG